MGVVALVVAATSLLGISVSSADSPENFPVGDPPFVTVSPSANLTDGQIVAVSGTDFPPSSVIVLSQCAVAPPFPASPLQQVCSTFVGPEIRTDASGNFGPINVPVNEVVAQDPISGIRTLFCGPPTSDCTIVADVGEPGGGGAGHRLFFGGEGPTVTTTTVAGGVTETTVAGGATQTTLAGGVTTTTAGGVTTTATACPTPCPTTTACPTPCPTATATACPTPCPTHPVTTARVAALVRTGSDNDAAIAWAAMALTLGGLLLIGAKGVPTQAASGQDPVGRRSG